MLSRTTFSFSSSVQEEEDKREPASQKVLPRSPTKTFQRRGGTIKRCETDRHEITHVPAPVRSRDRLIGCGGPIQPRYERVAF